ncbi:MAG TPA: TetR/AcrR family transcriptional regulator [Candidatus Dormibacteraeota bacterium]|nr:TetR/AcrR family transcriptional regulator [Candidatus Dormibacteraeota bacterium]
MAIPTLDSSRRVRKRQATRDRILAAAAELFAARGVVATMEEIAATADVAPATVFNYFPTKSAVLEGLATDLFGAIADGIVAQRESTAPLPDRLRVLTDTLESVVGESYRRVPELLRELVQATALDNYRGAAMARLQLVLSAFIYDGQQRDEIRTDVDAAFLALTARAMILAALLSWLDDPRYPLAPRLRQTTALLRDALARRPSQQE